MKSSSITLLDCETHGKAVNENYLDQKNQKGFDSFRRMTKTQFPEDFLKLSILFPVYVRATENNVKIKRDVYSKVISEEPYQTFGIVFVNTAT